MTQEFHQIELLIGENSKIACTLASWIAKDPVIAKAFAERDRNKLLELLLPKYENLKKDLNLAQFQFHLPPATSFLRLHKPSKFGDDLRNIRPTVVAANTQLTPQAGLDKGVAGMGIRGVVPVLYQNKHIGSVEFGMRVNDKLLKPLTSKYGFDISILVPKGNTFVFQARTHTMPIKQKMIPTIREVYQTGKTQMHRVNKSGKKILTCFFPLRDFSGNVIGVVTIPTNITSQLSNIYWEIIEISAISFFALLASFLFINTVINNLIQRPLNRFLSFFSLLEKGNYSERLDTKHFKCEMKTLATGVNTMTQSVEQALASAEESKEKARNQTTRTKKALEQTKEKENKVRELLNSMYTVSSEAKSITHKIASAAEKMSSNFHSVTSIAENQQTRVTEATTAIEQMKIAISEVTSTTSDSAQSSRQSINTATSGEKVVSGVLEAISQVKDIADDLDSQMDELNTQTGSVGQVIGVINDIADQTNLLALNAAIEAARAGESGRGFAVVADEVRKLAEKTMNATKEVEEKITAIQTAADSNSKMTKQAAESVALATELAQESGTALSVIVQNVKRNTTQAENIAASAEEQATASEQVSGAMIEINSLASEIYSNMQYSVSEISNLVKRVDKLDTLISQLHNEDDIKEDTPSSASFQ
ncbi:methyl-accepting chemotaxis protein [Maridesulfovibrio hydrothermalis]|nr:methyl-accepting chemotaxis protein [Maridesulfovibrio hydrothermalis]